MELIWFRSPAAELCPRSSFCRFTGGGRVQDKGRHSLRSAEDARYEAREGRRLEQLPDAIVNEVLARLEAILN